MRKMNALEYAELLLIREVLMIVHCTLSKRKHHFVDKTDHAIGYGMAIEHIDEIIQKMDMYIDAGVTG